MKQCLINETFLTQSDSILNLSFLKQLVFKSCRSFSSVMISCEELVIADGQVVCQLLKNFNVSPESMLPLKSSMSLKSVFSMTKSCENLCNLK